MCFRSQHVTIEDEEKMPNRSNLRRSTARNCGSTARTSQSAGCPHPNYGFRCYNLKNISGGFEANCVVAKAWPSSPVRCKHILCLLACIALSAAGADIGEEEVTYSGLSTSISSTDTPAHPLPEQYANIPVVKRDRRELKPFKSEKEHVKDDHNVNNEAPSPSHEGEEMHTATDGHRQDTGPGSLQNENKADNLATESKYFIMRLFRRYNSDHYLLTKDLEKLLENIGLGSAFPNSHVSSSRGSEEVHEDDHQHHHDDHDHAYEDHDHIHEDHDHTHENHEDHDHAHDDHDHSHNEEFYDGNENIDLENNHSNIDKDNQSGDKSNAAEIVDPQSSHTKQAVKQESDLKSTDKLARRKRQTREEDVKHQHVDHDHCLSAQKLLEIFQLEQDSLSPHDFLHLCPALIDQLDAGYCGPGHDGHNRDLNQHHLHTHEEEHHHSNTAGASVWLYAQLSVAVISLCSIAGVVVIPNMKRTFYNHILQFLVALAIGTMCGDAMLHLLPHALLSETHHETHHHEHHEESTKASNKSGHEAEEEHEMSQHMSALYKGLVGLIGMYGFFFLERLFTLFTNHRSTKQKRKSKRRRLCSGKSEDKKRRFHMVRSKLGQHEENAPSCEEMVMVVHANKALKALADVSHDAYLHQCDESLVLTPSGHEVNNVLSNGNVRADAKDDDTFRDVSNTLEGSNPQSGASAVDREPPHISDAEITGITKDQEEPIHSHSHLAQDMNGPLSSVAFMIVIGDMVHNFCDGLAIGAAFAGSMAGGLSTSVAVFCHELPHEIGDFAVLVRSGLSMRKAVVLNLLSSIPCFIGAVIGLVVGNVGSASLWIFAAVGGMFLYIALVDLIPEMTSVYTKTNEPWFLHLLLQASGIALGTTIMLIISVSEESLLTAFDDFHDKPSHP